MADLLYEGRRQPLAVGRSLLEQATDMSVPVPVSCRRSGRCRECVVQVLAGSAALTPGTTAEAFLPDGFRLACQAVVERDQADVAFALVRRRLRILVDTPQGTDNAADREAAPAVVRRGPHVVRDGEVLGPAPDRLVGLALDIGTTSVVAELVDLESTQRLATIAFENPQRFGGSDVVSRIAYEAQHPGELRRALRRALNRELAGAYSGLGLERHAVMEAVVAGNPTMRDLFFGLDVAPLGRWPFRSVSETASADGSRRTGVTRRAHEVGLLIHPRASVVGLPLVGSHVGADIAADLVATRFAEHDGVSLLMDIGTNSELVLSDGKRILAASAPAGPAFEGGGVGCGMAGADGAIESIAWLGNGFGWRTIGDQPPQGICGSGLVDLLAEATRGHLLQRDGTFADGTTVINVVPGTRIALTRADASALAQAKAANLVGQQVLLRRLGIDPVQVDRIFLAGAFANRIDVRHAMQIGLLLSVPPARVRRVGNASLLGARMLLLSHWRRAALGDLVSRIEHVELETEPDFFELFVEACRFEPASTLPQWPQSARS